MTSRNFLCMVLSLAVLALAAIFGGSPQARPTTASAGTQNENQDDFEQQLRARVERLKQEIAAEPTNEDTLVPRARVLWDWANAYAQRGGVLPVNLPATVARVFRTNQPGQPVAGARGLARTIDRYIAELQLRDEQPDAIGPLRSDTTGPFVADSYQTIRQTYTMGRKPLVAGGGILVAKHFIADHGVFQARDPQADNYVSISCSDPNARFVADTAPLAGMHGGFRRPIDTLFFRLEAGVIPAGETITVTYGDRSRGSRGFRVQTYSNDAFPLPLYLDLEGQRHFLTLPLQTYKVVGQGVHAVKGFAPSIVAINETFELSVRAEDIHYNRASGAIPAIDMLIDGERLRTIPASDEAITILSDLSFSKPGVYRFSFRSADGRVRGTSNPVWAQDAPTLGIYWGETHGHCGFAEGQGTADGFFRFGRDDARLDFLMHSEHDIWMDDREWQVLKDNVQQYNEEGKFIAFLGYEWTSQARFGGHHNVLFRTAEGRRRVPVQEAPTLSQLYQGLAEQNRTQDVAVIPHAHQPGDYRYSDPRLEPLIEIMSMHGRHEWFARKYLRNGHQVGFIAASDDHLSHPGYVSPTVRGLADSGGLAAVIAPEKTTDAIFDAMKNRQTYATTGDRIILQFELNGVPMGQRTRFARERAMSGRVIGTAPIDSIAIVKNGTDVWSKDFLTDQSGGSQAVRVTFASDNDPLFRDSPRGWRTWRGSLSIDGALVKKAIAPSFFNRRSEWLRHAGESSERMAFQTLTRGSEKGILLELDGANAATTIEISLAATQEYPPSPPFFRQPAQIPAKHLTFELGDLRDGQQSQVIQVDRFADTVTLQRVHRDVPMEQEFSYIDTDSPQPGDNYYVRVKQTNGAFAWSSPIWVGGSAPQ